MPFGPFSELRLVRRTPERTIAYAARVSLVEELHGEGTTLEASVQGLPGFDESDAEEELRAFLSDVVAEVARDV